MDIRGIIENEGSINLLIGSEVFELWRMITPERPDIGEVGIDIGCCPDILEPISLGHGTTFQIIL
jgi:hypothetical protein